MFSCKAGVKKSVAEIMSSDFGPELDAKSKCLSPSSCGLQGQASVTRSPQTSALDGSMFVEPVLLTVSQYGIHTLDTALQSWQQVQQPLTR